MLLTNHVRESGAPQERYERQGEDLRVDREVPAMLGQTPTAGVIC